MCVRGNFEGAHAACAEDPSETTVTYSCSGAPDYNRTVTIRNSISLVGNSSVLVPGGVSGP